MELCSELLTSMLGFKWNDSVYEVVVKFDEVVELKLRELIILERLGSWFVRRSSSFG